MNMNIEKMEAHANQAVMMLKALSNERRLLILCHLLDGEMCVGDLNQRVGLSQSALSQHLAVLRRKGLVSTRKEAQTVFYSLHSEDVRQVMATLYRLYCE